MTLINSKRIRAMRKATLSYSYRTLAYVTVLAFIGGIIGASTNNRGLMVAGFIPGLVGILLVMAFHHDAPTYPEPHDCRRLTHLNHLINGFIAFWFWVVATYCVNAGPSGYLW